MIENFPYTIIDIVVVGSILLLAVLSIWWGFIGLLTAIGAWIFALLMTVFLFEHTKLLIYEYLLSGLWGDVLTTVILFVTFFVIFMVLWGGFVRLVKKSAFGAIDRALGFIAGGALGYFGACLLFLAAVFIWGEENIPQVAQHSRSYEIVEWGAFRLIGITPDHLKTETLRKWEAKNGESFSGEALYQKMNRAPVPSAAKNDNIVPAKEKGYSAQDNNALDAVVDELEEGS